jgi:cytochrome c-type biogenesis protein
MTPDMLTLAPAAFLAGFLMFLAPCTLPIVPGYLAFIAGVPEQEIKKTGYGGARRRVLINAFCFVLGFSLVFIALGLFAASLGALVGPWRSLMSRIAGAVIIIFGLTMLGIVRIGALSSEKRIRTPRFIVVGRPESSFLIGVLFALGWTPCIGPILGTVLLFASTSTTHVQGALLLAVFSLGLGIPFIATALALSEAGKYFARLEGAVELLSKIAGGILVVFGACMLFGYMDVMAAWATTLFSPGQYGALLNHL